MTLAALIRGNKNTDHPPPANANPAKVAKVTPILADIEPKLAGLATLALAATGTDKTIIAPTPPPNDGRDLPHYCQHGGRWCSEKLPGSNYPAGCIRFKCEHHQTEGKTP